MTQNKALPPYRLHQSLAYHMSVAARVQEKRLDDGLKTLGLTRTTWCVLLAVGVEGLQQPSEIALFVGIDRTATSRALRQMETAGLIARSSGAADRRTTDVILTDKGCDTLAQGTPIAMDNNAGLDALLSAKEKAELLRLLGILKARDPQSLPRL
ncbi:Transcriptional regulator SlyA [Aquimixticola soesokkakensis]|uniref:Transcriptional regulator SlyA n=1 Tax=Aquimixticola soesokkakensis TaxID=1519096 RepID=A0A1Y5SDW6_9RHOB|nr:MarR family transcriptional regulator [Aquimixticola soesokkakensis]SLN37436.1 Transcriptional regulator SlyA [Aquimixticola soesokkakensis]